MPPGALSMTKPHTRVVRCLHCAAAFRVPDAASVLTCPTCYQRVRVDDVVVDGEMVLPRLETCGRIIVRRRGRLHTRLGVRASLGVEVLGELQAETISSCRVYIGPQATFRGDCRAGGITVETGATILGGRFQIDRSLLDPSETHTAAATPA